MSELPLIAAWERQAVKQLTHCFYLLAHGEFENPVDLANWLRTEAEAIELLESGNTAADEIFNDIMQSLTGRGETNESE